MTLANHWVRQRMTQPNMMIIKMSMEFELKRCALEKLQRRICCTNSLNVKNMGMRKIQEGWFFLERESGVCLGATMRNGSSEIWDREDPRVRGDQDGRRTGGDGGDASDRHGSGVLV